MPRKRVGEAGFLHGRAAGDQQVELLPPERIAAGFPAQQTQALGIVGIIGGDHPTFPCGDHFPRVEAETRQLTMPTDWLAFVPTSDRTRRILENLNAIAGAESVEPVHVRG